MTTFYGLGDEEPLGSARSVVALPKRVECKEGVATPITLAYEAAPGSVAVSLGTAKLGTVAPGSGVAAVYTASAGSKGQEDGFNFTLTQALKSSTSRITIAITEGDGPPPIGTFPGDWIKVPALASRPNQVAVTSAADLQTQINAAGPGRTIVVKGSFSGGIINVKCRGTKASPIIICGDNASPASYRTLSNMTFKYDGAERVIFRELDLNNTRFDIENTKLCQWECLRIRGVNYAVGAKSPGYSQQFFDIINDGIVSDCLIAFCEYEGNSATFFHIEATVKIQPLKGILAPVKRLLFSHIHFKDDKDGGIMFAPGHNPDNSKVDCESLIQYCLTTGRSGDSDWCEWKHAGFTMYRCTIEMGTTNGQWPNQIKVRQQAISPITQAIDVGRGFTIEECLFVMTPGGGDPAITFRGRFDTARNNWASVLSAGEQPNTTNTPVNSTRGRIVFLTGNADTKEDIDGDARRASSYKGQAGGNRGFRCYADSLEDIIVAKAENHRIPTSGPSRNSGFTNSSYFSNVDNGTPVKNGNIDLVPTRLFAANVGPGAWASTFTLT